MTHTMRVIFMLSFGANCALIVINAAAGHSGESVFNGLCAALVGWYASKP